MLIVRELESRIHDVLFEVGTTPVMQATSEPSGGTTQPTQQIPQHTDAYGRPCNPDEAGATLGGESGQSR